MTAVRSRVHIAQLAQQGYPVKSADVRSLMEENERLREALERLVAVYGMMETGDGEPCPDVLSARAALNGE